MDSRMKILILVCLLIFLIILVMCAPKRPIILENVFSQPDVDFKTYQKVAVLEFIPNPDVKKDKKFNDLVEGEFREKGYYVVGMDEFNSVLEDFGFSSEDLTNPYVLKKIRERLYVTAIIRDEVQQYEIKKKKDYTFFIWEGGASTVVTNIYICDISLIIEMIEVQEGNKVWSCSISCNQKKGKPDKLIRNMLRDSLNTIPQE